MDASKPQFSKAQFLNAQRQMQCQFSKAQFLKAQSQVARDAPARHEQALCVSESSD